jgi:hypothetical protein
MKNLSADLERNKGQENWEGEDSAKSKTAANSE